MQVRCTECDATINLNDPPDSGRMVCPYCSGRIEVDNVPLIDVDPQESPEARRKEVVPAAPAAPQPKPRPIKPAKTSNLKPQPIETPLQVPAHTSTSTMGLGDRPETIVPVEPAATQPAPLQLSAWDHFLGGVEDLVPRAGAFAGRTLSAGTILADECRRVWRFYRQHAAAMWLRSPLWSWLGLDLIDLARTVVVSGDELANNDDRLTFPVTCVVCGEPSDEPFVSEVRSIPDVGKSAWVVTVGLLAAPVVWWLYGIWWTAFALAIVLWGASRLGAERCIAIRFARCSKHAGNRRHPQLFLVSDGLLVRVGHRRARNQLARLLRGEPVETAAACGEDGSV